MTLIKKNYQQIYQKHKQNTLQTQIYQHDLPNTLTFAKIHRTPPFTNEIYQKVLPLNLPMQFTNFHLQVQFTTFTHKIYQKFTA